MVGQAEHLGLISCLEHSNSDSTEESSSSNADHCLCCQPLITNSQDLPSAVLSKSFFVAIIDDQIADGPVKAIDLPPQLS